MANRKFWIGMLVIVLVFGMTVSGCKTDPEEENDGVFTLINIPSEYNGKYAYLEAANDNVDLQGGDYNSSTDTFTAILISNGSVSLPIWTGDNNSVYRYSGNHTVEVYLGILNTADMNSDEIGALHFDSVTFSNGNATKSFGDGEWEDSVY